MSAPLRYADTLSTFTCLCGRTLKGAGECTACHREWAPMTNPPYVGWRHDEDPEFLAAIDLLQRCAIMGRMRQL